MACIRNQTHSVPRMGTGRHVCRGKHPYGMPARTVKISFPGDQTITGNFGIKSFYVITLSETNFFLSSDTGLAVTALSL